MSISWSNVWGTFKSQLEENLLPKSGGTMSGSLFLKGVPTTDNEAATKKYVDSSIKYITISKSDTSASGQTILGTIPNYNSQNFLVLVEQKSFDPSSGGYAELKPGGYIYTQYSNNSTGKIFLSADGTLTYENDGYDFSGKIIVMPASEISLITA